MKKEVSNETAAPAWPTRMMDVLWTSGGQQPCPGSLPLDEKYDLSLTQVVIFLGLTYKKDHNVDLDIATRLLHVVIFWVPPTLNIS